MDNELKEKALQFIWDKGYGKGTNLTLNSVAYLMSEFTQKQVKLFAIPDVIKPLPEYNEILYHAKTLTDEQFREYWDEVQGNVESIVKHTSQEMGKVAYVNTLDIPTNKQSDALRLE
jgi:hypothetical protein